MGPVFWSCSRALAIALAIALTPSLAIAQSDPGPSAPDEEAGPAADPAAVPAPTTVPPAVPAPTTTPSPDEDLGGLTDEELAAMAEVIELWDERPEKPYDRDTVVRLSGEDLARAGATDLGSALALLPDVHVQVAGRGGAVIYIRGARKGAVRILVDGVSVTDPYYGTFDVSTIPVTDIVQLRVSTSPASPIDGPGGSGGVIEVHTRDAVGGRMIVGRVLGDSLPTFAVAVTGRAPLGRGLAIRLSATATAGLRELTAAQPGDTAVNVDEGRRATTVAGRLEWRKGDRRLAVDAFADHRRYLQPPSDEVVANLLLIDGETSARGSAAFDDRHGALQLAAQAWGHALTRTSRSFSSPAMTDQVALEDLTAWRLGGRALVTRPIGPRLRWVAAATVDHERGRAEDQAGQVNRGDVTQTELAAELQYEHGALDVDAAAGVAAPLGVDAAPWPEAKLTARYTPWSRLTLTAIGARKGRAPALRDRFRIDGGNPDLDPEQAWHGELRVTARGPAGIELDVAPYTRRTTGTFKQPQGSTMLVNLGDLTVDGVDVALRARPLDQLAVGAAYQYTRATSTDLGDDPLDRLPAHRAEAWARLSPTACLDATVRWRYASRAVDREQVTPAYTLAEVSVSARVSPRWQLALRGDDLGDTRPELRSGYRTAGRTFALTVLGTLE